ncbi:MAG: HEAT repeat domain-containing protein [Pontiella sp.]
MFKNTLITLLLSVAVSHAAVKELIPNLTSENLNTQTQARLDLLAACSIASSPDGSEAERKAICLEICQILKGNHPVISVIQPMLNNLERIGGEESVPTLVKLMSHKDEQIRDDARRALLVNPSLAAAQALGAELKKRKARSVRTTAGLIYALGERKQEGASRLIIGALGSPDQEVFIASVKTLGTLNEDVGVQALFEQRAEEQGFRRMQIEAALLSTGRKAIFEKLQNGSESDTVRSAALLGLILNGDSSIAAGAMASGKPELQVAVIEAALQGKDAKVYDVVAVNVGSLPPHLQLQALGALEFSGNRTYAKAVEPLLKSDDTLVQDNASHALARIGTAESISALMTHGRAAAKKSMGLIDDEGVDSALEKIAATSTDENKRAIAIDALAIRGRRDLLSTFLTYAADENRKTATAAAMAIGSIGEISNLDPLIDLMIAQETSPVSRDLLNASVAIMRRSDDQAKAVGVLVGKMEGASPRSQANILQALVQTQSEAALKSLAEACRSSDEKLQKTAVKLLGGWKASNGIPTMLELAGDDSVSLANHVVLMRGVSRMLAAEKPKRLNKKLAEQAIATCRREEEKQAIQATLDKAK